jgi:hypothetical protein
VKRPARRAPSGIMISDSSNGVLLAMGGVAVVSLVGRSWRGEKNLSEMTEGIVLGMLLSGIMNAIKHPTGKPE